MKQCLVIDDSSVVRKVARRIFEELDFTVVEAEDGSQALDVCQRTMPDMVLVDWNMPGVSGVEFVAALRARDGGASENDVAQITRAMRAGADDYLLKPFNREIVEAKLQEIGLL